MTRSEEREIAFSAIYESGFGEGTNPLEVYTLSQEVRDVKSSRFVEALLQAVVEHSDFINEKIDTYAVGWKRNRISRVSLSILTLAAAEMYFFPDIPKRVSLNEGIELAKKYDEEKASAFINGILNAMAHDELAVGEE